MRGSNTLILNQATVTEALQEYLDKRMTGPGVIVKDVKKQDNTLGAAVGAYDFVVSVTEKKDELPRDPIQHKV